MTDPVSSAGEIRPAAPASQNDNIRSPWYDFFHTFIRHPMALISGDSSCCWYLSRCSHPGWRLLTR